MCGIITATGQAIPPVFIFPRKNMKDRFLDGAPIGSIGLAHQSGYMTAELFLEVLKHIKMHLSASKENPLLILMDNHSSHISLEAINLARESGITLLSFPPHCSHKLQPLDVAVYGSYKAALRVAMGDWLQNHPGRPIQIYDVAQLCGIAFPVAFTMKNITSGFRSAGLWPINRLVFTDEDYEAAETTDRNQEPPTAMNPRNPEDP
ncbi:uncharacterized protein [Diabrotica undecimpunctata]|uniref:uncharacterized protein n=1 Tax=Diabrotica undecimpunctata TaxID=50387 RepID=UPI003B638DE6